MKAIVHPRYGSPDVLRYENVQPPLPGDEEVLVRVHAASVNAGDWRIMRANPFFVRLMVGGLFRPKHKMLGMDMAGRVEVVGDDVTEFAAGDEVFGDLTLSGFGGFAEFVAVPANTLAMKPSRLSFEEAAALPVAGLAALQGLRDEGDIEPGHAVLVNGASGGVGSFAVQIARAYGAQVTGVCSTDKVEMVRSLGADRVIDYLQENVLEKEDRYDIIFDAAAHRSPWAYRDLLKSNGRYVLVGGSMARMVQAMLLRPLSTLLGDKQIRVLMSEPAREDLETLADLVESGRLTPAIDRYFTLEEVPEAIRYLEAGRVRGKVVISVAVSVSDEPSAGGDGVSAILGRTSRGGIQ